MGLLQGHVIERLLGGRERPIRARLAVRVGPEQAPVGSAKKKRSRWPPGWKIDWLRRRGDREGSDVQAHAHGDLLDVRRQVAGAV